MTRYLIVEEVSEQGRVEVGRLSSGEVAVGRDPGEPGIKIDNTAISRRHGVFFKCSMHWLYKDLGSTNGSWINGIRTQPEHLKIVRPGDLIQLADTALAFSEASDGSPERPGMSAMGGISGRSLLAFKKGEFIREFPIPEYGRSLVIGGSNPDLELEGDLFELPSLVIERRGDNVCVYSQAKELPVYVNEQELADTANIKDGDEITILDYLVLFNDPSSLRSTPAAASSDEIKKGESDSSTTNLRKWFNEQPAPLSGSRSGGLLGAGDFQNKAVRKSVFGQRMGDADESDETIPIDTRGIGKGYGHPGLRSSSLYSGQQAPPDYSLASLETKIILGIFFFMMFALMVLVVWWAMA